MLPQSCQTLCDPADCSLPGSSVHGDSRGLPCPPPGDLPNPRDHTQVSCAGGRFFLSEPRGKLKNTGVRSLALLQGIFPNPRIKPGPPALQVYSLPAELPEKAMTWISVVITYLRWCLHWSSRHWHKIHISIWNDDVSSSLDLIKRMRGGKKPAHSIRPMKMKFYCETL